MCVIRNDVELKLAYEFINMFKNEIGIEDYIKDLKKSVRKYNNEMKNAPEYRTFASHYDDYRVFAETGFSSVEEAYKNYVGLSCYPFQLGRWYVSAIKFFQKPNGKVYAYAHYCMNW